jgi:hypothetical protein
MKIIDNRLIDWREEFVTSVTGPFPVRDWAATTLRMFQVICAPTPSTLSAVSATSLGAFWSSILRFVQYFFAVFEGFSE